MTYDCGGAYRPKLEPVLLILKTTRGRTRCRNMNRLMSWTAWCFIGVCAVVVTPFRANGLSIGDQITVAESGVSPTEIVSISVSGFYSGGVYAGLNQLLINGSQTMNGFCIDPFHFSSSSSLPYTVVPLPDAPKGNLMGANSALLIERLWGSYYSPTMTAATAAGMQIAIWELVGGTSFKLTSANDFGASGFLANVESLTYSGPVGNLVGLTGQGQDYVVATPSSGGSVPDGGTTAILLGGALCALAAMGRQFRRA